MATPLLPPWTTLLTPLSRDTVDLGTKLAILSLACVSWKFGNYLVLVRFQTRWEPLTIERERLVSHLTLREPGLTVTGLSIL